MSITSPAPFGYLLFLLVCTCIGCIPGDRTDTWIVTAPAEGRYTEIDRTGTTVIPNGRLIRPVGQSVQVAPHPYGLTLSPDGSTAITSNSGVRPFSISIIRGIDTGELTVQQVPEGAQTDEGVLAAVFMGLAVSNDGSTLYAGGGQEGKVILFDLNTGDRIGDIDANSAFGGQNYEDSYLGDLVLSDDNSMLYAVDQTNFRVIAIDLDGRQIVGSVSVGRYPFGITLTPDQSRVYVANVGMYEYSMLEGLDAESDPPRLGTSFPPFAQGSKEAREGTEAEGYGVPGLGDPNVDESFSVWGIDVSDPASPNVISRIKTGFLVGEKVEDFPTVGGSSPNSLVSTDTRVIVTNGNNDSISIIDTEQDSVVADLWLQLDERLGNLRGHIPFGIALSPDGGRLYIAESGINAVAVVDLERLEVLGHIPVGWFPSKVAITPDGTRLIVANAKGWGSGPNGGSTFDIDERGSYIGNLMNGFVSVLDIPADNELPQLTEQVVSNNFLFRKSDDPAFADRGNNPIPLYAGQKESPIKHLVFITKENRTYDEVFGQRTGARGAAELARYGLDVTVTRADGSVTVEGADVMPNHHALADRFGISDNFYVDSDVSADGHRWLVGVYPNEWVETGVSASYGGGRRMKIPSTAPGMLAFVGSSGAIYPEDYNEAGSIWEHFDRFDIDFFNFGLGFEFAPAIETQEFKYTGIRLPVNYPMPGPLLERTSRKYATYNMNIPDQFRVDMFIEEFEERWMGEGKTMPRVVTMMLPNDHGDRPRPDDGYPFGESYMLDNDLALGRVVEYLSRTPYWNEMAIVVTEDDAQGGVDHIDAHRSLLMVISPYAKQGHVSTVHYSFSSIMKTFWHVLGTPYLNQYDAGATDLADFFTDAPDFTPYDAIAPDLRVFNPENALDPLDEEFNWEALSESPVMDDVETMQAWAAEEDEKRRKRDEQ